MKKRKTNKCRGSASESNNIPKSTEHNINEVQQNKSIFSFSEANPIMVFIKELAILIFLQKWSNYLAKNVSKIFQSELYPSSLIIGFELNDRVT